MNIRPEVQFKVLLVDDERAFVKTLSRRLQRRNIDTTIAYGGAEALDAVNREHPTVVVLDLKMPDIDGFEVLRRVKTMHPEIELIILTAHGSLAEERLVFELGAFACLHKPVDIDELTETMRQAQLKTGQYMN